MKNRGAETRRALTELPDRVARYMENDPEYADLGDDPDALVIRGVESETDDLPIGNERLHWNPAALAAQDAEKERYIE